MGPMTKAQPSLLADDVPLLPPGMRYSEELVSAGEEAELAEYIAALPLKPFEFVGGFVGNRRVVSFGWRYDFNAHAVQASDPIPPPLLALRAKVAVFAAKDADLFQQVLVTEYSPGAGIGWHKDRPIFGDVVGVSLVAPCLFRLRRKVGEKWERRSFVASPRSAYLLAGVSRNQWEHSIPPLKELRYSVTFRNFRDVRRL
jgi:alkylated DNA repair dioxygenase AlkB